MMRLLKIVGIVVAVLLVLGLLLPLFEPLAVLLFGWIAFPLHTLPKMTVEPVAVAVGVTAFVLLIALTHGLARWLYDHLHVETQPRCWRLRWSVSIVGIVVLLFASGICIIVTIHQIGWIATSNEPIIVSSAGQAARRAQSSNQLKQVGLAFYNYEESQSNHQFPPGGTFNQNGEMQHSWETMLLPFMEHAEIKPDLTLPWNHPGNAEHFKVVLREFINPGVDKETQVDPQGYGLSHYAVNSHVLGPNRSMRLKDVTDGVSNTILAGEVNAHFQPWGHPVNWRDPALGINKSPDGFGGPWKHGGANFLFMDGSVRFLSDDIDPAVMQALSTPNGGEKIPKGDW